MKLRNLTTATALTLMLALSAAASAQTPDQQPAPASPYKVMIFEIKHRDPDMLAKALDGLRSSGTNTAMVPNRSLRTITVRDYP
jgi:hypothetical protein